jgi:hypothetical protein
MGSVFEGFSDRAAPPGHVTFSVLDMQSGGHSVTIASKEYPGVVRATKAGLSSMSAATVFEGAIEIIRRSAVCTGDGCLCEDDGLLYAFIGALLKHPDKRTRKLLGVGIRGSLKKIWLRSRHPVYAACRPFGLARCRPWRRASLNK